MGLSRRQSPSGLPGSCAGEGEEETKPSTPRDEMPSKLPKRAVRTKRSMRCLQNRGSVDRVGVRLGVRTREPRKLAEKTGLKSLCFQHLQNRGRERL